MTELEQRIRHLFVFMRKDGNNGILETHREAIYISANKQKGNTLVMYISFPYKMYAWFDIIKLS